MDHGSLFVLTILLAFVMPISLFKAWTRHKAEMARLNATLDTTEKDNLKNELAGVKTRLEVLEAIVTDKKYQLSEEIAELRSADKPRVN